MVLTGCRSDPEEDAKMLSVQAAKLSSSAEDTAVTIMALDEKGQPIATKKPVNVRVDATRWADTYHWIWRHD